MTTIPPRSCPAVATTTDATEARSLLGGFTCPRTYAVHGLLGDMHQSPCITNKTIPAASCTSPT